jgi:CBS domain-containing protein
MTLPHWWSGEDAPHVGCGLVPDSIREAAMNVKDILARKGDDVLTIEPTATLATAMEMLARRRIGALVITGADRRIVGIISERDIVRVLVERGTEMLQSPVSEIMTRKVVSCGQNETIAEIMERMTAGKFRHVPVVEQGRLIGIVSIGDIVKARLEELEKEQDALRDYIRTA